MKKFTAIVCALALVAFAAQSQAATKWSAGVKGGVNMADLSGDDVENTSMKTGFMGGAFAEAGFTEDFGLRIEGLYVMKGAEVDSSGTTGTLKADYIEFPVLFVAKFPAGEKLKLSIFAGPTFGFNINAESESQGVTVDYSDDTKSFEFGAAIGAGGEIMMSSFSIVFDARYSLGATTIAESYEDNNITYEPDIKTNGIGIMAGLSFPLGGGSSE